MPTHTKPPKQPTVADVPSLSSWRSGIPKNWGKTPSSMFVPANLWNAPPEQKYVTKNFLSEIFSWNTLHNFTPFSMHAQARPEKCRLFSCFHDFGGIPRGLPTSNSQVSFAIWALHQYEHSYWNHGAPQLNSESSSFRWCTNVLYISQRILGTDWYIYQHLS